MKMPHILTSYEGDEVDPSIEPLLEGAYLALTGQIASLPLIKHKLEDLLLFLSSPRGRTHVNCVATDQFFVDYRDWPVIWDALPESYVGVLSDIGGLLHDAVISPEIAANFDSTPELLLERVRQLPE